MIPMAHLGLKIIVMFGRNIQGHNPTGDTVTIIQYIEESTVGTGILKVAFFG